MVMPHTLYLEALHFNLYDYNDEDELIQDFSDRIDEVFHAGVVELSNAFYSAMSDKERPADA